jgi:hypothetical protein
MNKSLFLPLFCLLSIGCFAPKLTPEAIKKREADIEKATITYYNAQLAIEYPKVYLSYYNELTTREFALYAAYAEQTQNGVSIDFKDSSTKKTRCLAYYEDKTLRKPIGDWQIFDDKQRLIIKQHFDENGRTITYLDSLQNIESISFYQDFDLKTYKAYYPTGELQYSDEYTKIGYKTKSVRTAFRKDKTKKYVKTDISTDSTTIVCFDEKDKPMDCANTEKIEDEPKAEFPGGQNALLAFLANNIKYPLKARETGAEGKVYVRFIVNKKGDLEYIVPVRYPDVLLMRESMRVIKTCPKWTPGQKNGKPVRVQYSLPVVFMLE